MDKPASLTANQKYLSHHLSRCLDPAVGVLTPQDVIERFPPHLIMQHLPAHRRGEVLQICTGLKLATATRYSEVQAGDALQLALENGDTTELEICEAVGCDDFVRYLPNNQLWQLIDGTHWFDKITDIIKALMAEMHDKLFELRLLTHFEVAEAIGYEELVADSVPIIVRAALVKAVHKKGASSEVSTAKDTFTILTSRILVNAVLLPVLYRPHLVLADKNGWLPKPEPKQLTPGAPDVDDEDSRPTGFPPAIENQKDAKPAALSELDEPGDAVFSEPPPPPPSATATEAAPTDEDSGYAEVFIDGEEVEGAASEPAKEGSKPGTNGPPPLPPRANAEVVDAVDRAFDEVIANPAPVPISLPGDKTVLTAASQEAADQWRGADRKPAADGSKSGGSKSGSKPRG